VWSDWASYLSKRPQTWLALLVGGGIGGAAVDQIHVVGGVLTYPAPWALGQAWWVAPLFGLATWAMYVSTALWAPWSRRARPAPVGAAEIAVGAVWFLAAYVASAAFQAQPWLLVALFTLTWLRRLVRRPDAIAQAAAGVALAVGGTLAEIAISSSGAFAYRSAGLASVPVWLPGLYLHGGPLAIAVVRRMKEGPP